MVLTPAATGASARVPGGGGLELQSGTGIVTGERLAGELRWWWRIRWRADQVKDLELHALLTTVDGASVVLSACGREAADGAIALLPSFEAQDERYRWLNAPLLFGRGRHDRASGQAVIEIQPA